MRATIGPIFLCLLTTLTAVSRPATLSFLIVMPSQAWLGTDLPLVRPDVKTVQDPYSNQEYIAFPAINADLMVIHAAAVNRAKPHSLVVVDMPWMSYHVTVEDAVRNAGRLVAEGGAEAVKLEGGSNRVEVIEAIVAAEIPVMGHLGLTPQSVNAMGGYKVQGKAIEDAQQMIADARALQDAGVFSIVLEGVPDVLAEAITEAVDVPTIGIGAGDATDGQVLVFHDVLGIGGGRYPKFVRSYADLRTEAIDALRRYAGDVQSGAFPSEAETYHVRDEVARMLADGGALSDSSEPSSSPSS